MAVIFQKIERANKLVLLKKYCSMTGDTAAAVHARRKKGIWLDDKHTVLSPDKRLWVNTEEVERWVKYGNKVSQ